MVTYLISDECIVLQLPDLEGCDILALLRCCLLSKGLRPWSAAEAEMFQCGGVSLLIARPRSPAALRVSSRSPLLIRRHSRSQ